MTPLTVGSDAVVFGPYSLIPSKRLLIRGQAEIPLGDRAFDTLSLLVSHAGEVVSKREILKRVWPGLFVDEANLRAQIAHLRSALDDDPDNPSYITNVRGRGYIFTAAVERTDSHSVVATQDANVGGRRRLPRRGQRLVGREQALDDLLSLTSTHHWGGFVALGFFGSRVVENALSPTRAA